MSDKYQENRFDIGITNVGSTGTGTDVIGFLLAQDRNVPIYSEFDDAYLATQRTSGVPGYDNLPPEKELAIVGDDFRAGFGQDIFDASDPKRYFSSFGADLRHKGRAILGWKLNAIAVPSITPVSITNANFETITSGWTGGSGRDGGQFLSGSFSYLANNANMSQSLTFNANHKGHSFRFICWVLSGDVSTGRIAINDGDTTTFSDYHTGSGLWEQLTVDKVIGSAATELTLELYSDTANNVYFDDAEIWQPVAGITRVMGDFAGRMHFGINNELYKLNATGDGFTSLKIFPTSIVAMHTFTEFCHIAPEHGITIEDCEDPWVAKANVTATTDTGDFKVGSGSCKLVVAAGLAVNNLMATEDFAAVNISSADGMGLWIKTSIDVSAGDLELHLSDSGAAAAPTETLAIPALTAGKWTQAHLDLASKEDDTAIISVGLYQATDIGPATIHLDDIRLEHKMWSFSTGETFTQSTLANAYAEFLQTVLGTTPTLYLGHKPNEIRASTDPSNAGAWGGVTEIDSSTKDITELREWQNLLQVFKTDKPYYIDGSGNVQDDTAPGLETEESSTSGKNSLIWQNMLYIQAGSQTFVEVLTDGTQTFLSPALFTTNQGEFVGEIFAMSADAFNIYIITDNSTKIEILAGRREIIDGVTRWTWHPIGETTLAGCEISTISNVFSKRLWFSSTSATDAIMYMALPATHGNIENDANADFLTSTSPTTVGYFETSWLHGNFKADNKHFTKLIAHLGHDFDTDIYFEAHYKIPGGSYVDIGDLKGTATNRHPELFLPDSGANPPFDEKIRLLFVGKTDDSTKTPVLEDFDLRATLYPPIRRLIACTVRVANDMVDKQGIKKRFNSAIMKETLDNARSNAKEPILIKDIFGDEIRVKILPVPKNNPRWTVIKDEKGDVIETHYQLLMQEIPLS